MLFLIPFQGMIMKKLGAYRARTAKTTDRRVKLENEMLLGIRAIKQYNWEAPFVLKANSVRSEEVRIIKKSAVLQAMNSAFMMASPAFVVKRSDATLCSSK